MKKRLLSFALLSALAFTLVPTMVQANEVTPYTAVEFRGGAAYDPQMVGAANQKTNQSKDTHVVWNGSNVPGNHREIFSVRDGTTIMGRASKWNHPADGWIYNTNLRINNRYSLWASRESRNDPYTVVWGSWNP